MSALALALSVYALTIVFSLLAALAIQGLGTLVKQLNLEPDEAPPAVALTPAPDAGEDGVAVAIVVAYAQARRSRS